jgi:excisionase family DNA binding protein
MTVIQLHLLYFYTKAELMVNESAYLSTKEAADILGISLRTAQLWVENGILKAWKTPGGHRRIMKASVDKALNERALAPVNKSKIVLRVLIVEDDPDLLNLLALTTQHFRPDIEVIIAKNGYEGLMMAGKTQPDLIFTDINMPEIDGLQMIRALGHGESGPRTIVAITALTPEELINRGAPATGIQFLFKPIEIHQIEAILMTEYSANLLG